LTGCTLLPVHRGRRPGGREGERERGREGRSSQFEISRKLWEKAI